MGPTGDVGATHRVFEHPHRGHSLTGTGLERGWGTPGSLLLRIAQEGSLAQQRTAWMSSNESLGLLRAYMWLEPLKRVIPCTVPKGQPFALDTEKKQGNSCIRWTFHLPCRSPFFHVAQRCAVSLFAVHRESPLSDEWVQLRIGVQKARVLQRLRKIKRGWRCFMRPLHRSDNLPNHTRWPELLRGIRHIPTRPKQREVITPQLRCGCGQDVSWFIAMTLGWTYYQMHNNSIFTVVRIFARRWEVEEPDPKYSSLLLAPAVVRSCPYNAVNKLVVKSKSELSRDKF